MTYRLYKWCLCRSVTYEQKLKIWAQLALGSVFKQERNAEDVKIHTTKPKTLPNPKDHKRKWQGEERTRHACHRHGVSSHRLLQGTHTGKGKWPSSAQGRGRTRHGEEETQQSPTSEKTSSPEADVKTGRHWEPAAHAPGWQEFKSRVTPSRVGEYVGKYWEGGVAPTGMAVHMNP